MTVWKVRARAHLMAQSLDGLKLLTIASGFDKDFPDLHPKRLRRIHLRVESISISQFSVCLWQHVAPPRYLEIRRVRLLPPGW